MTREKLEMTRGRTTGLIVLVLIAVVLSACRPAAPTEKQTTTGQVLKGTTTPTTSAPIISTPTTPTSTTSEKPGETAVTGKFLPPEQPKYGGELRVAYATDNQGWDEAFTGNWFMHQDELVFETPLTGDWAKGPYGTKEALGSWIYNFFPIHYETGMLAESWSFLDAYTIEMKIRQGVRFHNKAPVNGREMTADDVVFALDRTMRAPQGYQATSYPGWLQSITATDKWTVLVKGQQGSKFSIVHMWDKVLDTYYVYPRELVDKFGDLRDWRRQIGTGPFMIEDYVPGSMQYYVKNPNYWMKDPLHPENQLPYVDTVRVFIIPDTSTRIAALRTGKIDWLSSVSWDNWKSLKQSLPEMQGIELHGAQPTIAMRTSVKPFDDIRVRRALHMAIDIPSIAKGFFGAPAQLMTFNVSPTMESMYTPIDAMPESAQELFRYSPEKAKQLLAEAGFPNGFKTSVIAQQADVDLLSVVQRYWEDIGVIADIQVVELAVWTSHWRNHTHKEMMFYNYGVGHPYKMLPFIKGQYHNLSDVDDPYINERFEEIFLYENIENPDLQNKLLKESMVRYIDQAYSILLPTPVLYRVWTPWLQNYGGVAAVQYVGTSASWARHIWVDNEMKKAMGY